MTNDQVARTLLVIARGMPRETNLYRQRAYRQAAMFIQGLDEPLTIALERRGRAGLANIPGIGDHLAMTIESLVNGNKSADWQRT